MADNDSAEKATSLHDQSSDPEAGSGPSIVGDKPVNSNKDEALAPTDGGAAAWLVIVGAWCCSFSSPGWINSAS